MKLTPDQKAGLYITAIIHLAVIIVLLLVQIGYSVQKEDSFVLDFTRQEEQEKLEEQEELHRSAIEKLEDMIAAAAVSGAPVRNVAVNRSTQLKDDRNTDAEQLYKDAERLAQELRDGQNRALEDPEDYVADPVVKETPVKPRKTESYSGPSVLSWSLDGRRASHLPIPAYRCVGSGEVTVVITVDNQGRVVNAKVDERSSSTDGCLRNFATRAARLSRFSASTTAPSKQLGTITYAFIAQ
ncbi:MAG: energy transducer TonB [Bacteroidales bacterium]|nr:energy transducer TonB [Bacteroidales bacterium]